MFQSLIGNVQPDGMDVLTSGFMASFNPSQVMYNHSISAISTSHYLPIPHFLQVFSKKVGQSLFPNRPFSLILRHFSNFINSPLRLTDFFIFHLTFPISSPLINCAKIFICFSKIFPDISSFKSIFCSTQTSKSPSFVT